MHPKYLKLIQTNTDIILQLEFVPIMVTRGVSLKKPIDHKFYELHSDLSMITGKNLVETSKQFLHTGKQYQVEATPVLSNANTNNT